MIEEANTESVVEQVPFGLPVTAVDETVKTGVAEVVKVRKPRQKKIVEDTSLIAVTNEMESSNDSVDIKIPPKSFLGKPTIKNLLKNANIKEEDWVWLGIPTQRLVELLTSDTTELNYHEIRQLAPTLKMTVEELEVYGAAAPL